VEAGWLFARMSQGVPLATSVHVCFDTFCLSRPGIEFVRPTREDTFHRNTFVPVNKRTATDVAALAQETAAKKLKPSGLEDETAGGLLAKPDFVLVPRARIAAMMGWEKVAPIGAGLRNLGNSCYINSVMQCLAYTPPLYNYVATQEHINQCRGQHFCPLCAMCRLIAEMHRSTGRPVAPQQFLANLKRIAPTMRPGHQEDSHEWLRYLVDSMQSVLEKEACGGPDKKLPPRVAETTWLHQMFGGYILNQLTCRVCGHSSTRSDPFMDLSLEILGCATVPDCLRQFTRVEDMQGSNAWKCDKCDKKQPATKQMKILRSPHVLTLQLKRFTIQGQKRLKEVPFQLQLDLREFMAKGADKSESQLFSLFAVLVHTGPTTRSGHYTAFVRGSNRTWYHMDDHMVREVMPNTVLKQSAYVLFYVRDMPPAPKRIEQPRPVNNVKWSASLPPPPPPAIAAASPPKAPVDDFVFAVPATPLRASSSAMMSPLFAGLKKEPSRSPDVSSVAPALPPPPPPPKNGVVLTGAKEVESFLRRTESVAEFQEWEKTEPNEKKLAFLQKSLKERAMSKKKRVPLLDPELDKGKVKKVKVKKSAAQEAEERVNVAAQLDRAAKRLLSNRKAHRPKQGKKKGHKSKRFI
jgi:ubiquitin C-terminal hydrolase